MQGQTDTINKTDSQGKRIGYWVKQFPNGQIQYEGRFAEGMPVGTLKRYYESGIIKATLSRHPDSLLVHAVLYDEKGKPRASGPYLNQKKEKELSFELNNRVLQLNSLIDTGIEISK